MVLQEMEGFTPFSFRLYWYFFHHCVQQIPNHELVKVLISSLNPSPPLLGQCPEGPGEMPTTVGCAWHPLSHRALGCCLPLPMGRTFPDPEGCSEPKPLMHTSYMLLLHIFHIFSSLCCGSQREASPALCRGSRPPPSALLSILTWQGRIALICCVRQ